MSGVFAVTDTTTVEWWNGPYSRFDVLDVASVDWFGPVVSLEATFTDGETLEDTSVEIYLDTMEASSSWVFDSSAALTLDIGVTLPPEGVEIAQQYIVREVMSHPAIVRGRPIHPEVYGVGVFSGTANGTVIDPPPPPPEPDPLTAPPPPPPTTPSPSLDVTTLAGFKHRWISADVVGSSNDFISTWPEASSGPSFTSSAPNRPQLIRYRDNNKGIDYPKALKFSRSAVEFMRVDLGSVTSQPMTIYIIGWQYGSSTMSLHEHLLDGHDSFAYRRMLHCRPNHMQMDAGNSSASSGTGSVSGAWNRTTRLGVYTGIFDGASSRFLVKDSKSLQYIGGHPGTHSHRGFNLCKQYKKYTSHYAANFVALEIIYYEAAHGSTPRKTVERYAEQTYKLDKW